MSDSKLHDDPLGAGEPSDFEQSESYVARYRCAKHYKSVLCDAERLYALGGAKTKDGLALFDLESINIVAGLRWAMTHASRSDDAAMLCVAYAFNFAGDTLLTVRLRPEELVRLRQAAIDVANARPRLAEGGGLDSTNYDAHLYSLDYLGESQMAAGHVHGALITYGKALDVARRFSDRRREAGAHANLGWVFQSLGDESRAIGCCNEALSIYRKVGKRGDDAAALNTLGMALSSLGDFKKAVAALRKSIKSARSVENSTGERSALCNLGLAFARWGKPTKALTYYREAIELDRAAGDRGREGVALFNQALAFNDRGERNLARSSMQDARTALQESEHPLAASAAALADKPCSAWPRPPGRET